MSYHKKRLKMLLHNIAQKNSSKNKFWSKRCQAVFRIF